MEGVGGTRLNATCWCRDRGVHKKGTSLHRGQVGGRSDTGMADEASASRQSGHMIIKVNKELCGCGYKKRDRA